MTRRLTTRIFNLLGCLLVLSHPLVAQCDESDFVPVDASSLETTSGKLLLIISYAVILGLISLYSVFCYLRHRSVEKKARRLLERLELKSKQLHE